MNLFLPIIILIQLYVVNKHQDKLYVLPIEDINEHFDIGLCGFDNHYDMSQRRTEA